MAFEYSIGGYGKNAGMPGTAADGDAERKDFFVSYTGVDSLWAEWIAFALEEQGYTVLLQSWDFLTGGNFVLEMDAAARHCDRTIAVLSRAYCQSGFAAPEWAAAFQRDPEAKNGSLIPVRIEDFQPEGLFASISYVDLVGRDAAAAREELLTEIDLRVKGGRHKPATTPAFPGASAADDDAVFPGALPAVWNLPIRLRHFTGRADLLDEIAAALPGERLAILRGLGGIGKSRLAVEYAYRRALDYDVVWRVRARDEATARGDLVDLAAALDLPESVEDPQDEQVEAALDWLAHHDRWLLIVDDPLGPDAVVDLIPPGAQGHILITTQEATGWGTLGLPITVEVLGDADAVAMLRTRVADAADEELLALAEALGHLPLALEQAAAYMDATGVGPATYLSRLAAGESEPLDQGRPFDYERTVATTWRLAMEEIGEHAEAADLLACCSFLAPEQIARAIFESSDSAPVDGLESAALDAAIAELRRFSLVSLDGDRLSVHRLVQWAVRQALTAERRTLTMIKVEVRLEQSWPERDGRDPATWPSCAGLAPHIEAFSKLTSELPPIAIGSAHLLARVGIYRRIRSDLRAAADTFVQAIDLLDRVEAPAKAMIPVLSEYGITPTYLGEHEQAIAAHERTLGLLAELGREDTVDAANSYCLAGISFCEAGDVSRARDLYEMALTIFRREAPDDIHRIGSALGNLGTVTAQLGDTATARRLQEESLELLEEEYGPSHIEVAISLAGLARADVELEDLESAEQLMLRSLSIFEEIYGSDCMEAGRARVQLAAIRVAASRFQEAREDIEVGIEIYRAKYGPSHPYLHNPLEGLAMICANLGDEEAAERAKREAEQIPEQ